jgi:ABC-type multidrug transport system ATPase subunit
MLTYLKGIHQHEMIRKYKGEIVYNSEVDNHFPHLTVRQTLEFAAAMRTPRNRVIAVSRKENAKQLTEVAMAICGLSHTKNTKVGNDFIRGVSGGERKVSIKLLLPRAESYANRFQACKHSRDDISIVIYWLLG